MTLLLAIVIHSELLLFIAAVSISPVLSKCQLHSENVIGSMPKSSKYNK